MIAWNGYSNTQIRSWPTNIVSYMEFDKTIYLYTCLYRVSVESDIGYWISPHRSRQSIADSEIASR